MRPGAEATGAELLPNRRRPVRWATHDHTSYAFNP
jgi:hypothetical protein